MVIVSAELKGDVLFWSELYYGEQFLKVFTFICCFIIGTGSLLLFRVEVRIPQSESVSYKIPV